MRWRCACVLLLACLLRVPCTSNVCLVRRLRLPHVVYLLRVPFTFTWSCDVLERIRRSCPKIVREKKSRRRGGVCRYGQRCRKHTSGAVPRRVAKRWGRDYTPQNRSAYLSNSSSTTRCQAVSPIYEYRSTGREAHPSALRVLPLDALWISASQRDFPNLALQLVKLSPEPCAAAGGRAHPRTRTATDNPNIGSRIPRHGTRSTRVTGFIACLLWFCVIRPIAGVRCRAGRGRTRPRW
jgi:hypothetical protein